MSVQDLPALLYMVTRNQTNQYDEIRPMNVKQGWKMASKNLGF